MRMSELQEVQIFAEKMTKEQTDVMFRTLCEDMHENDMAKILVDVFGVVDIEGFVAKLQTQLEVSNV